jgi:hypothetical protein
MFLAVANAIAEDLDNARQKVTIIIDKERCVGLQFAAEEEKIVKVFGSIWLGEDDITEVEYVTLFDEEISEILKTFGGKK